MVEGMMSTVFSKWDNIHASLNVPYDRHEGFGCKLAGGCLEGPDRFRQQQFEQRHS